MRRFLFLSALLAVGLAFPAWADSEDRDLQLDHWSYPALIRFQTLGYLRLPVCRPWQRRQVILQLQELLTSQMDGRVTLSASDRYIFDRLSQELEIGISEECLSDRDLIGYDGQAVAAGADLSLGLQSGHSNIQQPEYRGWSEIGCWGNLENLLTFDQRLSLSLEKENAKYEKISGRLKTWRGGRFAADWSYFRAGRPGLWFTLGRQQLWWGPGVFGTMLLSDNSGALDAAGLEFSHRAVEFRSFFAVLNADLGRYLSGHRLDLQLPGNVSLGLSEAVVYQSRQLDPAYINPLLPYYANQWNQRDDDNVFWAADLRWLPGPGLSAYGELLMDDVQYEQDPPAPQKLGFLAGVHWADPAGLPDTDLRIEWAGNQKWVYTHRRYENRWVGPDTLSLLGHWVGTDADVLMALLEHRCHPRLNLGLGYILERHGEGRVYQGWQNDDSPATAFLSGTVSREDRAELRLGWEPCNRSSIGASCWLSFTRNPGNLEGTGLSRRGVDLSLRMEF
jgi:hypothetical protein